MRQVRTGKLNLSTVIREARQLAAGNLTVTVTSKTTGQHVTLRMRSRRKMQDGTWERTGFADATHVFIEDFDGERIATFYPQSGVLFFADNAPVPARWSAQAILRYLGGKFDTMPNLAEIYSADICGACGRELTDPVSIERGLGPECFGAKTGSRHAPRHVAA